MSGAGNPARLLVVDDDATFVTFVCAALEKLGVAVAVAPTGNDADVRLKSARFAGVLLDLNLPDLPGLDILRTIRKRGDLTPVVVLTGAGTVPAAVEAMKLRAVDFLEKPVRVAELTSAVKLLLAAGSPGQPPGVHEPLDRLVIAVIAVVEHAVDVPTVRQWATLIGKSESSLYALFEICGIPAKATLDLARLLRVNRCSLGGRHDGLDSADPRTVARLLRRACLTDESVHTHSVGDLLARQRLVADCGILRCIANRLT